MMLDGAGYENDQHLTYVPFLALRTFTTAGFCCTRSGHVASDGP